MIYVKSGSRLFSLTNIRFLNMIKHIDGANRNVDVADYGACVGDVHEFKDLLGNEALRKCILALDPTGKKSG